MNQRDCCRCLSHGCYVFNQISFWRLSPIFFSQNIAKNRNFRYFPMANGERLSRLDVGSRLNGKVFLSKTTKWWTPHRSPVKVAQRIDKVPKWGRESQIRSCFDPLFTGLVIRRMRKITIFMAALRNRARHYIFVLWFELVSLAALRSRCGHYIFALWFLLFSSPNLGRRRLDVYHTSTHGVALVRI